MKPQVIREDKTITVLFQSQDWYATKQGNAVQVSRNDGAQIGGYEAPAEWGENWTWNRHPSKNGIMLQKWGGIK